MYLALRMVEMVCEKIMTTETSRGAEMSTESVLKLDINLTTSILEDRDSESACGRRMGYKKVVVIY